jgi:hypothetical protein
MLLLELLVVVHVETEAGERSSAARCYWLFAFDFIDGFSRQPRDPWKE